MIRSDFADSNLKICETPVLGPSRCSGPISVSSLLRHGALTLVIVFAKLLAAQTNAVYYFHCPESYATDTERNAAAKAFVENFAKQHPQTTVDDLAAERQRLLIAHDCQRTLANIADNPKPQIATPHAILPHEQRLTIAGRMFTRVDEYYDSTTRIWSVIFVDDPQHPESFANQLVLNFYDWTPKPTSDAVATALGEEKPGAKNIFLFKAPDEPGGEMIYHIVSVGHRRGQANFVNVMSISGWEKAAANIDFSHRLGAGTDLHKTEVEARQWLVSVEGKELRDAATALRIGVGWQEYLKQVK
jgi:hypothetical protein